MPCQALIDHVLQLNEVDALLRGIQRGDQSLEEPFALPGFGN